MGSQEHFEKKESSMEKGEPSQLEDAIKHGEELVTHFEHQKSHTVKDVESLPPGVDRTPFNEKLSTMDRIGQEAKKATLAASFLMLTSNAVLAESIPKDQDSAPQAQEQLETVPAPTITMQETNMTLEIIKGVATMMLEQKKKDVNEVLQGVNTKGEEISVLKRAEKASGLIPSQVPGLGKVFSILNAATDIQEEIKAAAPGYEKNVIGRFGRLLLDIPTAGLASYAWKQIQEREKLKKDGKLIFDDGLSLEGDGGEDGNDLDRGRQN